MKRFAATCVATVGVLFYFTVVLLVAFTISGCATARFIKGVRQSNNNDPPLHHR